MGGLLLFFALLIVPAAATAADVESTATLAIAIFHWNPTPPPQGGSFIFTEPVEGVAVCETDTINCTVTDATGYAELQVPVDQEISYTLEKDGYGSYLLAGFIPAGAEPPAFPFGLVTDERFAYLHGLVMSPYPMEGTGSILMVPYGPSHLYPFGPGVTLDLGHATGKAYYYDEAGNWDPGLSASTAYGNAGFTEVSPGEVEVRFGGAAKNCVAGSDFVRGGWPGTIENSVRMPIKAGYMTKIYANCEVPEPDAALLFPVAVLSLAAVRRLRAS